VTSRVEKFLLILKVGVAITVFFQATQDEWSDVAISKFMEGARLDRLKGSYGHQVVLDVKAAIEEHLDVKGKHYLVIGSEHPWIEALLLSAGVDHVTSLDYNPRPTNHSQISTLTPMQLVEKVADGSASLYDGMITYSSVEHSGLGRYGDQLNPWGDLITMARAWCVLKPGSRAIVGVPAGDDTICFNAHRFYGPLMFSHLFSNWNLIYTQITDPDIFKFEHN